MLGLQKFLHVGTFQWSRRLIFPVASWRAAAVIAGAAKRIRRFRTPAVSANFRIIQQHNFDFGNVRHFEDGIVFQSLDVMPLSSNIASSSNA